MEVFHSINDFKSPQKTIVTLGTFDGMHIGHQAILNKLKLQKKLGDYKTLVLTFFPHPRMVLKSDTQILLLNTIEERIKLIADFGIDYLVVQEFTQDFANLSAEEFVKNVLVDQFNIDKIIIGYDHRFGKNRSADIHDLIEFGKKYHFNVEQISAEELDHVSISSTKIRKALNEGNVSLAKTYLGYPYPLTGKVVSGKQLGRTIGYPTANIQIQEDYKLIPAIGVYVVGVTVLGENYYGMLSIGTNPTVGGVDKTIEVYIFNFDKTIYDEEITVRFLTKIRDEEKFASVDLLIEALKEDERFSRHFIDTL
ncbi:bifunctional riboflavin kinase/FAD synthetase [Flavobacterium sp. xlx-214]|uniref:bifunctional riboflavin kinase/FAD synthetase n=1 Tax=unclassified Flavobacterium TaxID=196869 RepID=UPI0013D328D6|nr:bifunctional riboflavin kinase/FAD synthetase [Flavobacterium sp. xlx-214]MBA5793617.1 bifunctional riboflavin kinase/FAD synthetase [Flavobacterium sp. xlx-221]QMI84546.1 bifunctional riboflavin kinase/FAD synthetase [Flavobacterium sp. xlx-214]